MKSTTYEINGHTVIILDPVTDEKKRQERLERAAVRFWKAKERSEAKA